MPECPQGWGTKKGRKVYAPHKSTGEKCNIIINRESGILLRGGGTSDEIIMQMNSVNICEAITLRNSSYVRGTCDR